MKLKWRLIFESETSTFFVIEFEWGEKKSIWLQRLELDDAH